MAVLEGGRNVPTTLRSQTTPAKIFVDVPGPDGYLDLEEIAEPTTPPAGEVRVYANTSGGLSAKDDAGTVTTYGDGAGGRTLLAIPDGVDLAGSATGAMPTSEAKMFHVTVPAPMLLRSCRFSVSGAGSGTVQWGLFDPSADATACTKLAGGSGALNATGDVAIAASGGPVAIAPGSYVLIYLAPASNVPTLRRVAIGGTVAMPFEKRRSSYTWDDTPDITTGWSEDNVINTLYLRGDADGSSQF